MKKSIVAFVLCLGASVGALVASHWFLVKEVESKQAQILLLTRRRAVASEASLELERFRRASAGFRHLTEGQIGEARRRFRNAITAGIAKLQELDPGPEARALSGGAAEAVSELILASSSLEPRLVSRDIFQREQVQELHEAALGALARVGEDSETRISGIRGDISAASLRVTRFMLGVAGVIGVLVLALLIRFYFGWARPSRRIRRRIAELRGAEQAGASTDSRKRGRRAGVFTEVDLAMTDLVSTVDLCRRERQRFLITVAEALSPQLLALQSAANSKSAQASDAIRRSVFRLSRMLEDIRDLMNLDKGIRIEERVVELNSLVSRIAEGMGGASAHWPIQVTVPPASTWMLIDDARLERTITNLAGKIAQCYPQGAAVELCVGRAEGDRSVEISVNGAADISPKAAPRPRPGLRVDALRHWTNENGFGVSLAHRIVSAHGGTLLASGDSDHGVSFLIRLPISRLALEVPSPS